jgi:hypothetical protein
VVAPQVVAPPRVVAMADLRAVLLSVRRFRVPDRKRVRVIPTGAAVRSTE